MVGTSLVPSPSFFPRRETRALHLPTREKEGLGTRLGRDKCIMCVCVCVCVCVWRGPGGGMGGIMEMRLL